MGKSIYLYINDIDLLLLLQVIYNNDAYIYDKELCKLDKVSSISSNIEESCIGFGKNSCIEYSSCLLAVGYLQPGSLSVTNKDDTAINELYSNIKKYIRKYFTLSTDKTTYIGPNIYQDWIKKKYRFPMLLEYKSFAVEEHYLSNIVSYLQTKGFVIKNSKSKLRNINHVDYLADSFVVFLDESLMKTKIINKNTLLYDYESECIWLSRINKDKKILIILDMRLTLGNLSEISLLFNELEERWRK